MARSRDARLWPVTLFVAAALAVGLTSGPAHSGERFVPQAILQAEGLVLTVTGETVMLPDMEHLLTWLRAIPSEVLEERIEYLLGFLSSEEKARNRARVKRIIRTARIMTNEEFALNVKELGDRLSEPLAFAELAFFVGNNALHYPDGRVATVTGTTLFNPDGDVDTLIFSDKSEAGGRLKRDYAGRTHNLPAGARLERDSQGSMHVVPDGGRLVKDYQGRWHALPPGGRLERDSTGLVHVLPAGANLEQDYKGRAHILPAGAHLERDSQGVVHMVPDGGRLVKDYQGQWHVLPPDGRLEKDYTGRVHIVPAGPAWSETILGRFTSSRQVHAWSAIQRGRCTAFPQGVSSSGTQRAEAAPLLLVQPFRKTLPAFGVSCPPEGDWIGPLRANTPSFRRDTERKRTSTSRPVGK